MFSAPYIAASLILPAILMIKTGRKIPVREKSVKVY
jgi:hypothetical protein